MPGILTRGRGRKHNGNGELDGKDPRTARHRKGNGNNRSQKRQKGIYPILRGAKAEPPAQHV